MGKPSVPAAPTPPSQREIAEATVETAGHMARLQRAMEFGEELLKHKTNEDGSGVRYERVATDIPTGYKPVYSDQEVKTSGPQTVTYRTGDRRSGYRSHSVKIDSDGNTEGEISSGTNAPAVYKAGVHWSDMDVSKFGGSFGDRKSVV